MTRRPFLSPRFLAGVAGAALLAALVTGPGAFAPAGAEGEAVSVPAPAVDETASGGKEVAIFAGGCFWGVQGVFQHVKGVDSAVSGYAGGKLANPSYDDVTTETTGHAESVEVTFDPKVVSYGKLLQIFFSVVHDPTTLNRQGNDVGTSYRSALFTMNDEQKKVAAAYIAQLDAAKAFPDKIVTEVTPYSNFYRAEDYHQDNATTLKVNDGYVRYFDLPKIAALKATFPDAWREKPVLVFAANQSSAS
jgi:peptide-methionine (S)-S-oxide reductase